MRRISLVLLIGLLLPVWLWAAEISLNLDRCTVLNDATDQAAESKIALHFPIPDSLSGRRIYYVEMIIDVPIEYDGTDSLFELLLFPLMASWQEGNIDYNGSAAITDSALIGTAMVTLGNSNELHVDITSYVNEVLAGGRSNHGLIAQADLLGEGNLQISDNLGGQMRNAARVRIVYK
jgi:hypothetical protein